MKPKTRTQVGTQRVAGTRTVLVREKRPATLCQWVTLDSFGDTVFIAAGEPDNEAWCTGLTGTYSADSCATGYDGSCALPVGGDFTSPATAYYYGNSDPQDACEGGGGIYTAAAGS